MLLPELTGRFRAARTDSTLAVLEGFHAVKHAIRFGAEFDGVVTRDRIALEAMAQHLAPDVWPALDALAEEIAPDQLAELTPTPPETGVIAIARRRLHSWEQIEASPRGAPIVLLEAPSHPGNIGAVIRVAAGAGARAVVTTGANDPWQPAAIRGSAGLHYALPVARIDIADVLVRPLLAIDPDGEPLDPAGVSSDAVLAFGSERSGLSAELLARADGRLRIPMEPGVSSLNLATAVAVALYSWRMSPR